MAAAPQIKFRSSITFASQTNIGKEEQKKLSLIVGMLIEQPDSTEFRQPVDWKSLGLTDYPVLVKFPMDLSSVKAKLSKHQYSVAEECCDEIQLIWDNCKVYNAEGSWIYKLADKMEKYFKKIVKNYLPQLVIQSSKKVTQNILGVADIYEEEEPEGLSFSDKNKFSQRMKHLTQEQLGIVVQLVSQNCPSAYKNIDKDKCQILVDNLDGAIFRKINEQIDQWHNNLNELPSKKIKA